MNAMFCSHIPNEDEHTEWIARRGLMTKNFAHDDATTAKKFLDELTIFSVSEPESREVSKPCATTVRQEESASSSVSSSSVEEEEVLWKTAVDPHSGRTYYYHSITRQTTWIKPDEIRAMEKRLKEEERRMDKIFFKEMELNIYKSLERGEYIPGVKQESKHMMIPSTPAEETPSIEGTKQRVRTISGMDESLLAQLKIGTVPLAVSTTYTAPKKTSTAPSDIRGRPPLPRRVSRGRSSDSMSLSPEEDSAMFPDVSSRDSELVEKSCWMHPLMKMSNSRRPWEFLLKIRIM